MLDIKNPRTREDAAEIIVQLLNSLRNNDAELNSKKAGEIAKQIDDLLRLCGTLE